MHSLKFWNNFNYGYLGIRGQLIQRGAVNFLQFTQHASNTSPVMARYGMYFVRSNSELYFVSLMYVISCDIVPRYKDTWVYKSCDRM